MGARCWTRQVREVADELCETGRYIAREEYVRAKNGAIADHYLGLYRWLTEGCRSRGLVDMPPDAEAPIWQALTRAQRLPEAPGCVTLELEVPAASLFVLDYDRWGYRVNNWYVPVDREDEAAHDAELERFGIANEALLAQGPQGDYYPQLRAQLVRSWERIFEGPNADADKNVGVVWEIRRDWVKGVSGYDGA